MRSELEGVQQQLSIFEGLLIALDHRDEMLAIVARSTTVDAAARELSLQLGLTDIQVQAVLDVQVRRFAAEERTKIAVRVEELRDHLAQLGSSS
ncbi:hypothetical protein OG474_35575 [Kribbella sp. NBC_01505]|uniref:DNA gyrase subunit A n=1 Tax=Kribbella sp. NBC_01505 TaxID=2903580 RepID=UPI0038646302